MEITEKEILERLVETRNRLPQGVQLVAVSKTHPASAVLAAYKAGQRLFGENKVQEMTLKHNELPADIEWHFIGHVQKNKIKLMAPYVSVIQGIDDFEALAEVDRQAARYGRTIKCLLQIHVASEESKFGFTPQGVMDMLADGKWKDLSHVQIAGVMGMATNTDNEAQVISEFETLVSLFHRIKDSYFAGCSGFSIISAGMSDDHSLAIRAGSNMVRIGSAIFGARDYSL
ncbi:MAG: YggS family pyridoxal phosphate-dependent enzyme [Bacteroidaceae bacterium]|nr:YggS family pyridoxal phosphate-dependent enzyme [Bacteroidaceae bacterium]